VEPDAPVPAAVLVEADVTPPLCALSTVSADVEPEVLETDRALDARPLSASRSALSACRALAATFWRNEAAADREPTAAAIPWLAEVVFCAHAR